MADITKIVDLGLVQPTTPDNPLLQLAKNISNTDTTIVLNFEPKDENGASITKSFFLGLQNSQGYTETMLCTAVSGTSLTVVRGISLGGLDFDGDAALAVEHKAGAKVVFNIPAAMMQMVVSALQGNIGSGLKLNTATSFMEEGILANRVFADATARDTAITTPLNGMLCYQNDVQDYFSYKNGIWTQGLGGGGGTASFYQDSTDDGTLTGALDGVNTDFVMTSGVPGSVNQVMVVKNGLVLELGVSDDYTLTGTTITFNTAPIAADKIVVFYSSAPVGTGNAKTQATTNTAADNGELYRNTDDNQNLYYKDADGNVLKIHDKVLNKIPQSSIDGNFSITGEIKIWTTNTAPTGWLISDGTAVSRVTYANLFAVIGTTYGIGDGSTTFNLPNLAGNVPVGKDVGTFSTLGATGGEETHTLTESEMPAHTHTAATTGGANYLTGTNTGNGSVTPSSTTGSTGGNTAHNNLQPYIVMNYIIKT